MRNCAKPMGMILPYHTVIERPIENLMLITEGQPLTVRVPGINCILGDKLTAFAPHTAGVPFGVNKELEIIKQMLDCWTLFQQMDDFGEVVATYQNVVKKELAYQRRFGGKMLEIGTRAPAFTLPDQNGEMRSLADYQGQMPGELE